MPSDIFFLKYAAQLASHVDPHKTSPNPRVGCVVVRDDKIVAEGVHDNFGGAHAEANALGDALLEASTVYVTLEPCDCFAGKQTPSCTQKLINLKPKRVVIGALDPHFSGKNVEKLRAAGMDVEVLEIPEFKALNPFFEKFITQKKPYLCVKMAQSLDGCITGGDEVYLSNEISRKRVHVMRSQYSAILTTVKTILADDPKLDVRGVAGSNPDIIILGKKSDIPETANIFKISDRKLHFFNTHDLEEVLDECGKLGIDSLMTECGPTLAGALLAENLVDEVQIFIAPKLVGDGVGWTSDLDLKNWKRQSVEALDGDIHLVILARP